MPKFAIIGRLEIAPGQTKVLLYELYTDDAAFQVHWNGPSTARLREEAVGMIMGVTGTRCALAE